MHHYLSCVILAWYNSFEIDSGVEAETSVAGTHHMREVLGSKAHELMAGNKESKMLDYVIHETLSLTPGIYDEEAEAYNTSDPTSFTVALLPG